jgi:S-phase kinase-associated protein 1
MSELVKGMLEDESGDCEDTTEIPLSKVKAAVLKKVIQFCSHHLSEPMTAIEKPLKSTVIMAVVQNWYADFVNVEQVRLFELIRAANYMNIKPLLDLTCATVASMIKGKTPQEIRNTFNFANGFSLEEESSSSPPRTHYEEEEIDEIIGILTTLLDGYSHLVREIVDMAGIWSRLEYNDATPFQIHQKTVVGLVSDDRLCSLHLSNIRRILIQVKAHDQGWATGAGSWTFGHVKVSRGQELLREWPFYRNERANIEWQIHSFECPLDDLRDVLGRDQNMDIQLAITHSAMFSGWRNHIGNQTILIYYFP